MSITTKTGDKGETGLFGGKRLSKDDPRLEAIGCLDELNAAIGLLASLSGISDIIKKELNSIQETCFVIGGELATPMDAPKQSQSYIPRLSESDLSQLEKWLSDKESALPSQTKFILPGGCQSAALAFWIRSIVRRSERAMVGLNKREVASPIILQYLNRLADYFFILGRFLNQEANQNEIEWTGGRE